MRQTKTREQIHYNMSRVRAKGSKIELTLGGALWAAGLRYRKHYPKLVGKPDFVLVRDRIAIFCDSEFWHGYDWKNKKQEIKSNVDFWQEKIEANIRRDETVNKQLKKMEWTVLRFWERDILKRTDWCVDKVVKTQTTIRDKRTKVCEETKTNV